MTTWIIVGIIAVLVIAIIAIYNNLVRNRKEVDNSWAQIDVQLKRRCDLIPNLVETVKGYAAHESGVLEKVTQARSAAMSPNLNTESRIAAESNLSGALKGLMIQVEAYPDLKANQNFLSLQEELTATENRISFAYPQSSHSNGDGIRSVCAGDTVLHTNVLGKRLLQFFYFRPGNKMCGSCNTHHRCIDFILQHLILFR